MDASRSAALPDKLYIGADHGGFELKQELIQWLTEQYDFEIVDVGAKKLDPQDDYTDYAHKLSKMVLADLHRGVKTRGILVCRGGQGMAMAANRYKGLRASVVWSTEEAAATRNDNDSNILSISADHIMHGTIFELTKVWLETLASKAPRHRRRILQLDQT